MIRPISYSISFLGAPQKQTFAPQEKSAFIAQAAQDAVEKYDCATELIGEMNKLLLKRQKQNELLSYVTDLALKTENDIKPLEEELAKYRENVTQLVEKHGMHNQATAKIDGITYSLDTYGPLAIKQRYKGKPYNYDTNYEGHKNNKAEREQRRDQTAYVYFNDYDDKVEYRFRDYNLNDDYACVDMDTKDGKVQYISASKCMSSAPRTLYQYDDNEKLRIAKRCLSPAGNLKRDKLDKDSIMTFDENGKISAIYYNVSTFKIDDLMANAEHVFNRLDDNSFVQVK